MEANTNMFPIEPIVPYVPIIAIVRPPLHDDLIVIHVKTRQTRYIPGKHSSTSVERMSKKFH
jgi:hypothetical protein